MAKSKVYVEPEEYFPKAIRKEFGLEGTPVRIIAREKGEKEE